MFSKPLSCGDACAREKHGEKPTGPILVRKFTDRHLEIPKSDGLETFADAKDVLPRIHDHVRAKVRATKAIGLYAYELARTANFADVFGSLGREHGSLCLTEAQILQCLRKFKREIATFHSTAFLMKTENGFEVAYFECCHGSGKEWFVLKVFPIGHDHKWKAFVELAHHSHRLIIVPVGK